VKSSAGTGLWASAKRGMKDLQAALSDAFLIQILKIQMACLADDIDIIAFFKYAVYSQKRISWNLNFGLSLFFAVLFHCGFYRQYSGRRRAYRNSRFPVNRYSA
jgi:hypothetical protein